jgi:hypothetical protein
MAQYLNVRQRKWGTTIIQTVHILQLDSADTSSLPMVDFFKQIPNNFQITQPATPPPPPNHLKKCSKNLCMKISGPIFAYYC